MGTEATDPVVDEEKAWSEFFARNPYFRRGDGVAATIPDTFLPKFFYVQRWDAAKNGWVQRGRKVPVEETTTYDDEYFATRWGGGTKYRIRYHFANAKQNQASPWLEMGWVSGPMKPFDDDVQDQVQASGVGSFPGWTLGPYGWQPTTPPTGSSSPGAPPAYPGGYPPGPPGGYPGGYPGLPPWMQPPNPLAEQVKALEAKLEALKPNPLAEQVKALEAKLAAPKGPDWTAIAAGVTAVGTAVGALLAPVVPMVKEALKGGNPKDQLREMVSMAKDIRELTGGGGNEMAGALRDGIREFGSVVRGEKTPPKEPTTAPAAEEPAKGLPVGSHMRLVLP